MSLVGIGKSLVNICRPCGQLVILGKWFLYGFQLLDGRIQVEIKCWSNAELRQSMFDRRLNKSVHNFFIFELDFLFGGMHVYIHLLWIQINEQYIKWITVRGDHIAVSMLQGVIEI